MLILLYVTLTESGKWILDIDPLMQMEDFDDGWHYDELRFDARGLIRSDEVDKLYSAMGKAAQRMPRLRYLEFGFRGENTDWEGLIFCRNLETQEARLEIRTDWEYYPGEEVIIAWGLECDKADEFRTYRSIEFDHWPSADTGIGEEEILARPI
jgi:hypothetical protein